MCWCLATSIECSGAITAVERSWKWHKTSEAKKISEEGKSQGVYEKPKEAISPGKPLNVRRAKVRTEGGSAQ
jgi:hypothetical protein